MEFALYSRRDGEGYEAFAPAGVWINTAGAVAGDYISFIQSVCEIILTSARDALEAEANRQGRTLAGELTATFGSKVIQLTDETVNPDSVGISPALNEGLSD
jgi:hypothetical protein